MSVDILAIVAHPDDAELNCAGLLLKAQADGATIGVLDMTLGELSSRGDVPTRKREAAHASEILNLDYRHNLELNDGSLSQCTAGLDRIVHVLRELKPKLTITAHWEDHHPDHRATSNMVREAWYLAGIGKYGEGLPHRGESILYYIDRTAVKPDLVLDVSSVWEQKLRAVQAYASQLGAGSGPQTLLSHSQYLTQLESRHHYFGGLIGVSHGEAYAMRQPVPLNSPSSLLWGRRGIC